MASIRKQDIRKYKITVCNGYRPDGRKICRSRTIQVPESVGNRGIQQYVRHEAEELERQFRFGYLENAETSFEDFAKGWLDRQTKYAAGALGYYRRTLSLIYPLIGKLPLNRIQPIVLENMLMKLRKHIYLTESILSLLLALAEQGKRAGAHPNSGYLFINENGSVIHPDTFTKRFRRLCDENGLSKSFHLHTLRHYFVSTMLHNGVDKQTVAELAGHGDTSFLERTYCHPQMLLKQQAANTLVTKLLPEQTVEPVSA